VDEAPEKEFSWGPVIAGAIFVGMVVFAIWIVQDKKHQKEREAVLLTMDKELATDEQAVKDERRKLEEMTKSVEELRTRIQYGQVKDGKAAVEEFNKKAAEQRAEREKFVQMADQYNQKVAKFHQLEQ
jgi:histidinol dehydrogenase